MTTLDTRRERARKLEPLTTLGETPAFKSILESRHLKSLTDTPHAEQPPPAPEVVNAPEREPVRHAQAVQADRPAFLPVPEGLMVVSRRSEGQGIRVLRSEDDTVSAIQFAENRIPSRAEKDILEALGQPEHVKFTYQPRVKVWTREDRTHTVANIRDALGVAEGLAKGREGRSR